MSQNGKKIENSLRSKGGNRISYFTTIKRNTYKVSMVMKLCMHICTRKNSKNTNQITILSFFAADFFSERETWSKQPPLYGRETHFQKIITGLESTQSILRARTLRLKSFSV